MGEIVAETEYLRFVDATPAGRKTTVLWIYSRQWGDALGEIRWFGRWRQYAFFPEKGTAWNPACLDDVNERIRALMAARRA